MRTGESIGLIAMSNAGKSRLAEKLAFVGFSTVSIDEEIEKKLLPYVKEHGFEGIEAVALWMGQPFEPQYPANSLIYLDFEIEAMKEVLDRIERGEQLIIDTTGSVIYTGEEVLRRFQRLTNVVLLDADQALETKLLKEYLETPKPVIWGDNSYAPMPGEDAMEALKRCYPTLLRTRNARYRALAHKKIDYLKVREKSFTFDRFLAAIQ